MSDLLGNGIEVPGPTATSVTPGAVPPVARSAGVLTENPAVLLNVSVTGKHASTPLTVIWVVVIGMIAGPGTPVICTPVDGVAPVDGRGLPRY